MKTRPSSTRLAGALAFMMALALATPVVAGPGVPQTGAAQPGVAFDSAVESLAAGLVSSEAASRPIRVAFLPLLPGESAGGGGRAKDFGPFFSERLAASVKGAASKIRIFERQRLDAILAEHELDASGAVDSEGAMRIGELAPVDALFTGSYARVGGSVAVNVRLVSVVSGELLFARALTIALDDSLADFFSGDAKAAGASVPLTDEERLKAALAELRALLADLTTDAKVSAVVAKAVSYPLFGLFSPVHELVAESLARYKKASPAYRAFLVARLSSAELVGEGDELYALIDAIDYLRFDGALDDAQFAASLSACRAMSDLGYYSVVFKHILSPTKGAVTVDPTLERRIGSIVGEIRGGRMGKPVGVEYSRGILELLGALQDDTTAFLAAYDQAIAAVPASGLVSFAQPLRRRFEAETDPSRKSRLLERVADNANAVGLEPRNAAQELYTFLASLDGEEESQVFARDFAARCAALLSKAMPLVPYNKDERILLCLRYGIAAPGLIPAFGDIVHGLLLGDGIEERRASASMLQAMGVRAAPAELAVDKVLGYLGDGSIDGMGSPNLQMQCYDILAGIGTRAPASLALIATGMRHDYSDVRAAAADAFFRLGPVSTPYVLELARSGAKALRLDAIKLLARMGRAASSAAAGLEAIMKAEKDGYLRDAMADALSKIRL